MEQAQLLSDYNEKITNLRIQADELIQLSQRTSQKSAEITLAFRHLQMTKGWLGKLKGAIFGPESNPYFPADEIAKIPPTADVYTGEMLLPSSDHLADVNLLREKIKTLLSEIESFLQFDCLGERLTMQAKGAEYFKNGIIKLNFTCQHLEEASMCLGFELARLRESKS